MCSKSSKRENVFKIEQERERERAVGKPKRSERMVATLEAALEECQHSSSAAAHRRLAQLIAPQRSGKLAERLTTLLRPVLVRFRRDACVERVVRFVVALTVADGGGDDAAEFTEAMLLQLVSLCRCADKAVRFRSCQLVAGVLNAMSQEAEVSDEVWESVEEVMLERLADKAPPVRLQAVRALARLQEADETGDFSEDTITQSLRSLLATERNKDVRKAVLASLAVCDHTLPEIVARTADVSDDVRRVAFIIISGKVPFDVLSITHRAHILKRGLADRDAKVRAAAMDTFHRWIEVNGGGALGLITVIEALDVETNEEIVDTFIREIVGTETLSVQDLLTALNDVGSLAAAAAAGGGAGKAKTGKKTGSSGTSASVTSEQALCWRVVSSILRSDAQSRGAAAASALGTGAVIEAAAAVEKLDLLDKNMPKSASDFIALVRAHLKSSRFSAWQLLRMAPCLELSDSASRAAMKDFLLELLRETPEVFDDGTGVGSFCLVGAGGDGKWERSVVETLAAIVTDVKDWTEEITTAVHEMSEAHLRGNSDSDDGAHDDEPAWWVQALVWVALTLERAPSFDTFSSSPLTLDDINENIVVPALQHESTAVRQYAVRVLGLLCCIDMSAFLNNVVLLKAVLTSTEDDVVRVEAAHSLADLCLLRNDDIGEQGAEGIEDSLFSALAGGCSGETLEAVAEGLAKLLMFEKIKNAPRALKELLLMYISSESAESTRLQQCLAVFFAAYAASSHGAHEAITAAFVPAVRTAMAADKKSAVLLIKFLHQLAQTPVSKPNAGDDPHGSCTGQASRIALLQNLACEIIAYPKTTATAPYIAALAKVIACLSGDVGRAADGVRMALQLVYRAKSVVEAPGASNDLQSALEKLNGIIAMAMPSSPEQNDEDTTRVTDSENRNTDATCEPSFDEEEVDACDSFLADFETRTENESVPLDGGSGRTAGKRKTSSHKAKGTSSARQQPPRRSAANKRESGGSVDSDSLPTTDEDEDEKEEQEVDTDDAAGITEAESKSTRRTTRSSKATAATASKTVDSVTRSSNTRPKRGVLSSRENVD